MMTYLPFGKFYRSFLFSLFFVMCSFVTTAQVSFTADTVTGCDSLLVTFTNTSGVGSMYYWEFDDGNDYVGFDTAHLYTWPGEYKVRLSAFDGGGSFLGNHEMTIIVKGLNSIWHNPVSICPGDEVSFGPNGIGDSFIWDFGDGSTSDQKNPRYVYSDTGTYGVTLIMDYTCATDTDTVMVTVDTSAIPYAGFSVGIDSICPGDQVRFYPDSYSESYMYRWIINGTDTLFDIAPYYTFLTIDTHEVVMNVFNACGNMGADTNYVITSANVPWGYIGAGTQPACPGDKAAFFVFGNDEINYSSYAWDFGDGTMDTTNTNVITHAYADTGSYLVSVTVINGCGADTTLMFTAMPDTTIVPDLSGCDGKCFGVPEETTQNCPGDSIIFWFAGEYENVWYFGDGDSGVATETILIGDGGGGPNTATIIKHAYADTGSYWAVLKVTNSCGNSTMDSILIVVDTVGEAVAMLEHESPMYGSNFTACETVRFLSFGGTYYEWDFGDGNTATDSTGRQNHTYTSPGNYTVKLIVTNGCGNSDTTTRVVTVTGMNPMVFETDATCPGGNTGAIDLAITGGIMPYSYAWDNGATEEDPSGLMAGVYGYTVTDALGCVASGTGTVGEPPAFNVGTSANNSNCGSSDGSATVTASGATPPYTYMWNDVASHTSVTATGLAAGNYEVTVTDNNGCIYVVTASVNDNTAPSLSTSTVDVSCNGLSDGSATANASGGSPPYLYVWDDGSSSTTGAKTGLMAGTYCVTATDINTCLATACVVVSEPPVVSVNLNQVDDSLFVNAGGGTAPYGYQWTPGGATTDRIGNIGNGTYYVTVTDDNGCAVTDSIEVTTVSVYTGSGNQNEVNIYPNPYKGFTHIVCELKHAANVEVAVYDLVGREIAILARANQQAGVYQYRFAAGDYNAGPGTYIVRIRFDDRLVTKRIVGIE